MNINANGVLLEELRSKHSFDLNIVDQLDKEFGDDYYDLVEEYNDFWDNGYFEQVKTQSSGGAGHIAGAGPVDYNDCLLYTSPSPRDRQKSRMPSSA